MADEKREGSYEYPIIITPDEVWKIIGNQIEVQEQLRRKGQQTLLILSSLAVIFTGAAGASIVFEFNVPDSEIENTASNLPTTTADVVITLIFNYLIAIFLLVIAFILFLGFIYRNYEVSRHSSLHPSLGERKEGSVLVVANSDYRELISDAQVEARQYEDWICTNNEILSEKREELEKANADFILLVASTVWALIIVFFVNVIRIIWLLYIDILILIITLLIVGFILLTRDKQLLTWKGWPVTKQQKEDLPYLDSLELHLSSILYTGLVLVALYVVLYHIRELTTAF